MYLFDGKFFLRFEQKNLIQFIDSRSVVKVNDYLSTEDKAAINRDLKYGNTGWQISNSKLIKNLF